MCHNEEHRIVGRYNLPKFQAANLKNGHFRAGQRRKIPQLPVCLIRIDRCSLEQWRNLHPRYPRRAGATHIGAKWSRRKISIILKMTLCYSCFLREMPLK